MPDNFALAAIKPRVPFSLFDALDIRRYHRTRRPVPHSEKLMRLPINFGDHTRNILGGIKKECADARESEGRQALFALNLEPRCMSGEISEGMLFDRGYTRAGYAQPLRPQWHRRLRLA